MNRRSNVKVYGSEDLTLAFTYMEEDSRGWCSVLIFDQVYRNTLCNNMNLGTLLYFWDLFNDNYRNQVAHALIDLSDEDLKFKVMPTLRDTIKKLYEEDYVQEFGEDWYVWTKKARLAESLRADKIKEHLELIQDLGEEKERILFGEKTSKKSDPFLTASNRDQEKRLFNRAGYQTLGDLEKVLNEVIRDFQHPNHQLVVEKFLELKRSGKMGFNPLGLTEELWWIEMLPLLEGRGLLPEPMESYSSPLTRMVWFDTETRRLKDEITSLPLEISRDSGFFQNDKDYLLAGEDRDAILKDIDA